MNPWQELDCPPGEIVDINIHNYEYQCIKVISVIINFVNNIFKFCENKISFSYQLGPIKDSYFPMFVS